MSDLSRHIIWGTTWYPSPDNPTLGNFVQRHAQAASQKHKISVIVPLPGKRFELKVELKSNSLIEYRCYYPKFLRLLGAMIAFKKVVKMLPKADVFHGHALLSCYWMFQMVKAPGLLTEHWAGFHHQDEGRIPIWKKYFMKKAGRKLKCALPVTRHLGERMKKLGYIHNYQVISNVVDTSTFYRVEYPAEKFSILHVSTLHDPQKNISGLLRVAKKLQDEKVPFRLTIVGDGDVDPHKRYAEQLGISQENLEFHGAKTSEEIAEYMRQSHVFLLFSNYENFPCVIVESWACGRPVISTNVGGIHEHINDSTGWLINPQDEDGLFLLLKEVINKRSLPESEELSNYAEKHFSVEAIANAFHKVYVSC